MSNSTYIIRCILPSTPHATGSTREPHHALLQGCLLHPRHSIARDRPSLLMTRYSKNVAGCLCSACAPSWEFSGCDIPSDKLHGWCDLHSEEGSQHITSPQLVGPQLLLCYPHRDVLQAGNGFTGHGDKQEQQRARQFSNCKEIGKNSF